jgi:hypothetical protein
MSKQPRDDANAPIPVLALRPGGGQQIAITAVSARSASVASHVRVVTLFATEDAFIEIGDATVTANSSNSHFLPAGIPYDISLGSETVTKENPRYLAVIRLDTDGILYLSERI